MSSLRIPNQYGPQIKKQETKDTAPLNGLEQTSSLEIKISHIFLIVEQIHIMISLIRLFSYI